MKVTKCILPLVSSYINDILTIIDDSLYILLTTTHARPSFNVMNIKH